MPNIESILQQMTLEEKAALCTGSGNWTTLSIPRLGVPEIFLSDGPHGLRRVVENGVGGAQTLPATCFPTASCLASTWDTALLRELGAALAEECLAQGVDVLLGPGINMKRTPLCGRNFEYFSEDPFLAGELAAGWIRGLQERGVGASLKHFAANNQERRRFSISAEIDERTLREIYLPAFEKAVTQARPWTVMCAYNRINGVFCSEHSTLLTRILKEEWGFEGAVVSDWGAVHDRTAALAAGLDLEMPGPRPQRVQEVVEAVREGRLNPAALDDAVHRILKTVFRAAEMPKGAGQGFDADAHHALARRFAAEGMVLLKNNGILPLNAQQRIAVIGSSALVPQIQGLGSSHVNPARLSIPLEEIRSRAGGAEVTYSEGWPQDGRLDPPLIEQAVAAAAGAEVALIFVAQPELKNAEGADRADLDLSEQQVRLIQAVTRSQPASVVILNNGSALAMGEWIDGAAAVLEAWLMGQAGGEAVADLLFGYANPCGKLSETFPLRLQDTPAYLNYPGCCGKVTYGEGPFIGYRYYEAKDVAVQFPFGHGLSYTTFSYTKPTVSARTFRDIDGLTVSVDVTNTGPVAGKETVQVYVHDEKSGLARPPKELKGFARVELQPGETATVTIPLDFRSFAYYHPGYGQWITEDGSFEILIGASSADIRCRERVTLQSTLRLPSLLSAESTLREWLDDERGQAVVGGLFMEMAAGIQQAAAAQAAGDGANMMELINLAMDIPLVDILQQIEHFLPRTPAAIVEGMLQQVQAE